MRVSSLSTASSHAGFAQLVVGISGVLYTLVGLALLIAPAWFFEKIGTFPPFNRHYEGDLGSFLLPLGLGLLIAARDPARHKMLIAIAAGASLLHAFNHVYDSLIDQASLGHWLSDTAPLLVLGVLLIVAYRSLKGFAR